MRKTGMLLVYALVWSFCSAHMALGAVPPLISYQGMLERHDDDDCLGRKDERSPQSKEGDHDRNSLPMSFALFSDSTGGASLWSESYARVAVDDGVFHVFLGSMVPLPAPVFSGSSLWLETTIGRCTLKPRQRITTVGYAFRAAAADSSIHAATSADSVWSRNASGIYYNVGRVGIGTSAPGTALDVAGITTTRELMVAGASSTQCLTILGGCDISEGFKVGVGPSGAEAQPGMLVSIDPMNPGELVVASTAYDRSVAGILAGANGIRSGMVLRQDGKPELEGPHGVALSGRVYAYASTVNGPIRPGDLLTTSDTPGYAMKATDAERSHGAVIGKAMSALNQGTGFVLVLVLPQ